MAAVVEELRKLIPTLTKLDTVKELAIELSVEERQELIAFLQSSLYGVRRNIGGFNIVPINERMPGETEEEHNARIEAFLQDLDEIASDAPSDIVEDLRQVRQGVIR
jgi:formiminotetrahydrofolate cyclodeaminase